jgi:endonuclease/exonuclease/phosphatase family metal-dependent hydrolase
VICINEPKRGTETVIPDYRKHLSGKWYECSQGNLLILSRYRLQKEAWLRGTAVVGLQTRVDSNPPLSVLLIDVSPEADFSRVKVFQSLVAAISKQPELPDLILGDFNTPAGAYSIHRVLQLGYKDSYLVAGSGWGYTWNAWLPVMRIDMALARDSLQIVRHQSSFTSLSDHAWQWVDIRR